jgi:glutamate dehydrogenase/leucine dehydrogenase
MRVKFTLFVPEGLKDLKEVKEIWNTLLKKVETSFEVKVSKEILDKEAEWRLKFDILLPLAVGKRIKIHQTRRTKSLYPQLVVFVEDRPFTFYPQRYGQEEITIKQFLEGLLKGKVLCLHDDNKLKENVKEKFKS